MKTHISHLTAISGAIAVTLILLAARPEGDNTSETKAVAGRTVSIPNSSSDALLRRLCGKAAPHPKATASTVNTDSLKGSNWYGTVTAQIARQSYYIANGADGKTSSSNIAQGMKTDYEPGSFRLSSMEAPAGMDISAMDKKKEVRSADWQLGLTLDGLYADGRLACAPNKAATATTDTSELRYTHQGLLQVQYQNTEAGLRQNFIVERAPAGNASELRIALSADKGWVAQKTCGEIHFAKRSRSGGLSTKVIYKDLNVWDANGRTLPARLSADGAEVSIIVASAGAKYPVTIDPLATTAAATLTGPSSGSSFGYSVASAGDVNGDGYSDVIVGAYNTTNGNAYVYLGSSTGLSTIAATTLTGPSSGSNFGYSVASAGDVNGDGYNDVIVGAILTTNGNAYVYHGSSTGLSTTAATTLAGSSGYEYGFSVASAGDVNGDGYSDVVVGAPPTGSSSGGNAYVYAGSSSGISTTAAVTLVSGLFGFGYSVAGIGDLNGDGYGDVIVGADYYSSATGAASVFLGSSAGLSATAAVSRTGTSAGDHFGFSVAGAGDVNGDGYSDVIIGAYGVDKAYLYLGSNLGPATFFPLAATLNGSSSSYFGRSVASAGDVNGDGYSDVVVGANLTTNGNAYVYQGSSTGLSTTPAATLAGPSAGGSFGTSVAGAGDVNGDGYSDVVVGAINTANGNAYVYLGSAGAVSVTATATFSGTSGATFGYNVSGAGDVNGDGYSDVIVGAVSALSSKGAAYIYLGSATGLSTTAALTLSGVSINDNFGSSVASAGDVNGDGYGDVIVGAAGVSANAGAAYVFLGSGGTLSSTAATTLTGPAANSFFGASVAGAGDINGDGYGDVIAGASGSSSGSGTGNAYIYYGSATGTLTTGAVTLAGTAGSSFGYSVSGAGDVNGDGYGDVMIGAYRVSSNAGAAYIYHGSPTGISTTATVTLSGVANSLFGYSLAAAGDVNGDGYGDVVVGAYNGSAQFGTAYIFQGSSAGLATTAATTLSGPSLYSSFGQNVAAAGDVNGDGYSDVVVGAYSVSSNAGAAYIYQGSSTGLSGTASATLTGPSASSYFGTSVAGAGDVNGDGYSDVFAGAYGANSAYLYAGNSGYDKRNNTLRLYETNLTTPIKQSNRSAIQFGAGVFVRPAAGVIKARLVWETEKEGVGFMHFSPITNYTGYTAGQPSYTAITPAGVELKTLISKVAGARATKVRVRVQYLSALLPNGQKFGPWIYPQTYLTGAMGSGAQFGLTSVALPVGITAFSATLRSAHDVLLAWNAATPKEGQEYIAERSRDGVSYSTVGSLTASQANSYSLHDYAPPEGWSYYRLRSLEQDGGMTYSRTEQIFIGESGGDVRVYPLPARDFITIEAVGANTATVRDMQGHDVMHLVFKSGAQVGIAKLAPGQYILTLDNGRSIPIIKQ